MPILASKSEWLNAARLCLPTHSVLASATSAVPTSPSPFTTLAFAVICFDQIRQLCSWFLKIIRTGDKTLEICLHCLCQRFQHRFYGRTNLIVGLHVGGSCF